MGVCVPQLTHISVLNVTQEDESVNSVNNSSAQRPFNYAAVHSCVKCNSDNKLLRLSPKMHRDQAVCVMITLSVYRLLPASQLHCDAQNVVVVPCLGWHRDKANPTAQ